jgi:cell wall-associated NlpC family hydrolase
MLQKGTILEYKRCGGLFYHYAMYIGDNKVIHRDKTHFLSYGRIYVTDINTMKGTMTILPLHIHRVPTEVAINNAFELINKNNTYNVLTNNCEHFVNFVRYNTHVSKQIQTIKKYVICGIYTLYVLWNR